MFSSFINQKIPDILSYLSTQPVIRKVWIFGSCSRGEENPDSDVDFLVDYDRSHRYHSLLLGGLSQILRSFSKETLIGCNSGVLIPEAQKSANSDKILIYERKDL